MVKYITIKINENLFRSGTAVQALEGGMTRHERGSLHESTCCPISLNKSHERLDQRQWIIGRRGGIHSWGGKTLDIVPSCMFSTCDVDSK